VRRYTVTATWLHRGRYDREMTTGVIASSFITAVAKGLRDIKAADRAAGNGLREEDGARVSVVVVMGPKTERRTAWGSMST
jgi:hypothetical protein